jgi:hypothetical protein
VAGFSSLGDGKKQQGNECKKVGTHLRVKMLDFQGSESDFIRGIPHK